MNSKEKQNNEADSESVIHHIIMNKPKEEQNITLINDDQFNILVTDKTEKYQYFLRWHSNPKTLNKIFQTKIREIQKYSPILNDIDKKGIIVFSSLYNSISFKSIKNKPIQTLTEVPISLKMFKDLINPVVINKIETLTNKINKEYNEKKELEGTNVVIEETLQFKEKENIELCLTLIISTYKKANNLIKSIKKRKYDEEENENGLFITIRYEPIDNTKLGKFVYNFVQLPAELFINYLKQQTLLEKINNIINIF